MASPGFWDHADAAQEWVQKLKEVRATLDPFEKLHKDATDLSELLEAAEEGDAGLMAGMAADLDGIEKRLEHYELCVLLTDPNDVRNAYLSIHAGTGGTDACDWAEILLRMYSRWIEQNGYQVEPVDRLDGEEAGVKRVTLLVRGEWAFGFLKSERGVHRLVRISPFDANRRRQTAFCSVDVTAEFEDIQVEINEAELRVDTYRASGAGGQHVNVTDSAVRITHLPTNLVVQCQNERSQHMNRKVAMKMLAAKLYQLEEEKREQEMLKNYGEKGQISFGNQIRSYVMHPYTLVKDHRTDIETSNIQAVLDGDIDRFMEAYLKLRAKRLPRT